jgi:hypothetical protein
MENIDFMVFLSSLLLLPIVYPQPEASNFPPSKLGNAPVSLRIPQLDLDPHYNSVPQSFE